MQGCLEKQSTTPNRMISLLPRVVPQLQWSSMLRFCVWAWYHASKCRRHGVSCTPLFSLLQLISPLLKMFDPRSPPPVALKMEEIFEYLYGHELPGAHNALGDVEGLERILSAPGIAERWDGRRPLYSVLHALPFRKVSKYWRFLTTCLSLLF